MRNFIFLIALTIIPIFSSLSCSTWRCGSNLVSKGNTQKEVIDRCGNPEYRNFLGWKRVVKDNYMFNYFEDEPVEEWIYQVSDRLYYVLKFEGNELMDVNSHFGQ